MKKFWWQILKIILVLMFLCHCAKYEQPQGVVTSGTSVPAEKLDNTSQIGVTVDALQVGDEVWVLYSDGYYYPAQITKLINERYYVQFSDGSKGRYKKESLRQWQIKAGMVLEVKKDNSWESALVAAVMKGQVAVKSQSDGSIIVVSLAVVRTNAISLS